MPSNRAARRCQALLLSPLPSPPRTMSYSEQPGDDNRPLPHGWVKSWDQTCVAPHSATSPRQATLTTASYSHSRTFWVDTTVRSLTPRLRHAQILTPNLLLAQANPPRSIWTHPLDDPQFQKSQNAYGSHAPPPGPPLPLEGQRGDAPPYGQQQSWSPGPQQNGGYGQQGGQYGQQGGQYGQPFYGQQPQQMYQPQPEQKKGRRAARRCLACRDTDALSQGSSPSLLAEATSLSNNNTNKDMASSSKDTANSSNKEVVWAGAA